MTRTAFPPGAVLGTTRAAVPPHKSPALAPSVHEHTVVGIATKARALLPDLPPFPSSARPAPVFLYGCLLCTSAG